MKYIFLLLALLGGVGEMLAQDGHSIRVKIQGYAQPEMYLAYYMADSQYLLDTVSRDDKGYFNFQGEEPLPGGMYLLVLAPENNFLQILISPEEQNFSVETSLKDLVGSIRLTNAPDNQLYYDYLGFLNSLRPQNEALRQELESTTDEKLKGEIQQRMAGMDQQVLERQKQLVAEHPKTMTAALIRANLPLDTPEYGGEDETDIQRKKWRWTQQHFFDNIDLHDDRMLRSPVLYQRLDYYINKLTVQHPDTIADAVVKVLKMMDPKSEMFKFYLIRYLNDYAASNIVGMDAVYVRLVDEFYAKGLATWTDEEQLEKILDGADNIRNILIGKKAPDLQMLTRGGENIRLHDVEADYTILYFWRYDCGHCKKSTPYMSEFYQNYKDKNIKIFAVCSKQGKDIPECWKYVDENKIGDWVHVVDPYLRSRYNKVYDVRTTPQIFILDREKTIVSKRIGAEKLADVIDHLMEMESMEKQDQMMNKK